MIQGFLRNTSIQTFQEIDLQCFQRHKQKSRFRNQLHLCGFKFIYGSMADDRKNEEIFMKSLERFS
jgi:hypothetical protein